MRAGVGIDEGRRVLGSCLCARGWKSSASLSIVERTGLGDRGAQARGPGPTGMLPALLDRRWLASSTPPIGVAACLIERQAVVGGERADGITVLGVGITVAGADDDRPEPPFVLAGRWQHRRDEAVALAVAQREEARHYALDMGLEPDVL